VTRLRTGSQIPCRALADGRPILIAYDGSAAARAATTEAGKLFGGIDAIVLTVWEPGLGEFMLIPDPTGLGTTMAPYQPELAHEIDKASEHHAHAIVADGARLASAVGLHPLELIRQDSSDVADAILVAAQERGASVIVIGSRGLKGLRSKLLGSTSTDVLKRASCPVLIVRHPEDGG
jgi:nucleotide-binding universal stress UspA family protein